MELQNPPTVLQNLLMEVNFEQNVCVLHIENLSAPEPSYNEPEPVYGAPESTEYSAPAYTAPGDSFDISSLVVPVLVIVGKMRFSIDANYAESEAKLRYRKPMTALLRASAL